MDGLELFEVSQEMRRTPEFHRLQELDRFSNTLRIFEENYGGARPPVVVRL